ncbi:MAG TPA: nicotinate-nucleotide--dimethylbenzimidazole phosphoribosyltransferase [Silvibacterium sp.]|nr:nicotinate-nucleotide--dimethylbenzimidazole phosphoribosyltransferase [Silvibacterium sp.]
MNRASIDEFVRCIAPIDEAWRQRARVHLDTLTKPIGSLGRLEDLAAQIVAIRQDRFADPQRKAVYVFAADHGIVEASVSAYPRAVTHQMVLNFLREGAAINVLARQHGAALHVVDVGVDAELERVPGLLHHKVRRGTRNMLREAAMSEEDVAQALGVGARLGEEATAAGYSLLAIGEMGIGNTTAASAITCALTGAPAAIATGRGTGLESEAYARKVRIVEAVIRKHCASGSLAPFEILRCLGGLEIAAMAGMVLAAARHKIVVVTDGFISTAAAALAVAIEPNVFGYLIAGHRSEEPGHQLLLDHLKLTPVLSLGMRLGEGTGAVLAMPVIESALSLYTEMATFASAGVSEASR